jgi:isopenicillin-N epimerase
MSATDWSAARRAMMLEPSIANLNTGSFGPLPAVVFERTHELRKILAAEPMNFYFRRVAPLLWHARTRLAEFVGCSPRRLIFTNNVTASVNMVASSITLTSPGEILMSDHEYLAMHWTWERAARRLGLTLRTFPLPTNTEDPGEIIDAARKAMTSNTRLFFFSHVLSATGLVLPAKQLCEEARKRGIVTVVDGAHAPAFLPLNLADIPCDFYGSNCHKWLLAHSGSGFLYFAPGTEDRIGPLQVSWGWHTTAKDLDEPDEYGTTARIRRLEFEGTRDLCPWLTIPEAIDFQANIGFAQIDQRRRQLGHYARERIGSVPHFRLATPTNPELHGPLTAFEIPACDPVALRAKLWAARVEVPVVERPDRLMIRTSGNFYNTEAEFEQLREVLTSAFV